VALTMSEPTWTSADLELILGTYGAFIVERAETDMDAALKTLAKYKENIWDVRFGYPSDLRFVTTFATSNVRFLARY
jgi:hypothetical protein